MSGKEHINPRNVEIGPSDSKTLCRGAGESRSGVDFDGLLVREADRIAM